MNVKDLKKSREKFENVKHCHPEIWISEEINKRYVEDLKKSREKI